MPEPNPERIVAFASPLELGQWLGANHASERELWVKIFKKKSGMPSVGWDNAYVASEMAVPSDFLAAVEGHPEAKQTFETLNKTNRLAIAHALSTARRPETRQRRFDKFLDMLVCGEKSDVELAEGQRDRPEEQCWFSASNRRHCVEK